MIYCEITIGLNVKMTDSFLEMSLESLQCCLSSLTYLTTAEFWNLKVVTSNLKYIHSHRVLEDIESRHLEYACFHLPASQA